MSDCTSREANRCELNQGISVEMHILARYYIWVWHLLWEWRMSEEASREHACLGAHESRLCRNNKHAGKLSQVKGGSQLAAVLQRQYRERVAGATEGKCLLIGCYKALRS